MRYSEIINENITPQHIHKLADKKGVKWDNEPGFLALTKRLTGKEHLDDLDQAGLKKVKDHLDELPVTEQSLEERRKKKSSKYFGGYFYPGYGYYGTGEGDGGDGGESVDENFADGKVKGKSRPGRVKRAGASCNGSVTDLRARAKKASGERAKMYHWCANMKSGRKK